MTLNTTRTETHNMCCTTTTDLFHFNSCRSRISHFQDSSIGHFPMVATMLNFNPQLCWVGFITLYFRVYPCVCVCKILKRSASLLVEAFPLVQMVQPILVYCIAVWGYALCTHIRKIQRFQNRAAWIISGNWNWEMSGLLIVKRLKWLNVTQRREYFMGVVMHRCIYANAPNYLKDLLIQVLMSNNVLHELAMIFMCHVLI